MSEWKGGEKLVKIFANGITISKWTVIKSTFVIALVLLSFFLGATTTVPTAYTQGYEKGVMNTLDEVKAKLASADIDFNWAYLGDGKYTLEIKTTSGEQLTTPLAVEVDLLVQHFRNGQLIDDSRGAGTLTTFGKNWIEKQLSGTLNSTETALYLSDSNDATAPDIAWTVLPSEITSNGLERALGTYTSTGDGAWNVTKTKSVTGTQSTQLWGLNAATYVGTGVNTLIAADSTPDQKNCISGDTLAETWQVTVS